MKKENKKKSLFERLNVNRKSKKSSCCCNFEIEEIPEEQNETKREKTPKDKGGSC